MPYHLWYLVSLLEDYIIRLLGDSKENLVDFISIGPLEIIVVVVVALLVLGPQQMLDVAQKTGRSISKMQGTVKSLLEASNANPEPDETTNQHVTKPSNSKSQDVSP